MEFPLPLPIRPVVIVATIEIRRAPNLILRDVGPEATKAGVVVQLVPRKGILLAAKAQEAAEGEEETVSGIARGLRGALRLVVREGTRSMANEANENRRPQPWWAKLLEKVGLGSFVKR